MTRALEVGRRCQPVAMRAFSLVEVVVAAGIFAGGITVLIGYLVPLAKTGATQSDAITAAGLGAAIRVELESRLPVDSIQPGTSIDVPPLFATRDGILIGDPAAVDAQAYFRIEILPVAASALDVRSERARVPEPQVSPYIARIRWPVYASATGSHMVVLPGALRP